METPADTDLRARFLGGMAQAAATVNVVTTDGPGGRAGITVSAMSSVSADTEKPVLLICIHHQASVALPILENGVFCVNVLRDDQSYISDTFAGRFRHQLADKFACAEWTTQVTGAPRVVDPLVAFDCRLREHTLIGTHFVFFGEVEDIFMATRGSPLIYANRAYGVTTQIEGPGSIGDGIETARRKLAVGCFHTFGPFVLPPLLDMLRSREAGIDLTLIEGDQRRVLESLRSGQTELALLYDIDLPDAVARETMTELHPYVLLPDGHPLGERPELAPQDLADEPMVLLDAPPSRDYFLSLMRAEGVAPRVAYRSVNFEMVRGMVGHGLGFSILATKPAAAMTYDGRALISRPLHSEVEPARVVLAYHRGAALSSPAEAFARLCREFFGIDPHR
jgi:flavin reductase (DIM6/NTAB) family NADH-FMN oxidoreductase RutF/DNA-binding transcriptional LysR family regulator